MKKAIIVSTIILALQGCMQPRQSGEGFDYIETGLTSQEISSKCDMASQAAVIAMMLRDNGTSYERLVSTQKGRQPKMISIMTRLPYDLSHVTDKKEMESIAFRHCARLLN